jgi:hypothetical protein
MKHLMAIEPVMVTNLVAALMALLVAFNVPLTDDQRQAVMQLVGAIVAIYLGSALVARSRVYSPATVARMMHEQDGSD